MICSVGAVLYLGSISIYQKEAENQHQKSLSKLWAATRTLEIFFTVFHEDLFFLRDLTPLKTYVKSGFRSASQREEVEGLFKDFLRTHPDFYSIGLYNGAGSRVLTVESSAQPHFPDLSQSLNADPSRPDSPDLDLVKKDALWVSPITVHHVLDEDRIITLPIIGLSTSLPGSDATPKNGYVTLGLDLNAIMQVLPAGVQIQTGRGNRIVRSRDGSVELKENQTNLTGDSGWLTVSPDETVHYIKCEFLPGQAFYVVVNHKHPGLKNEFHKLVWLSIAMLAGFSALAAAIGFIAISRYKKLLRAQYGIIFSLAALAEGRDPETGEHLERTREYAILLAKELRKRKAYRKTITTDYLDALYASAPLHDIGKVGIPDAILLKESGLTEREYETMKTHVLIGNRVLKRTMETYKLNQTVFTVGLNIATFHHERYDGLGYPDGLKGEEIPLEARIFALCDAYDTIRIKRPYKGEMPHEEAIARILEDKGKHFDPLVVEAFIQVESQFKAVSEEMK